MITELTRRILVIFLILLGCVPASAQETETTTAASRPANAGTTVVVDTDSRETRAQLHEILRKLPPEVGRVLQLDPTLWTNESYLSSYPALKSFIAAHPEVARSPEFFLEGIAAYPTFVNDPPGVRMWRDALEGVTIMAVILTFVAIGTWLIRTFVDHRRWSRVSKVQAEVHGKLLDRFSSNQELLAYIETSAGRRFLESAPLALEPGPRPIGAPINRILWSVQAGLVVIAGGIGLRYVAMSVEREVAGPLAAMGSIGIAIGLGLVISAAAAYLISRKLGLWQPALSTSDE